MMILVAYDISRDDTRDRVAKKLLSMGYTRIQRSVYVARGGVAKARDTARMIQGLIDEDTDRVDIILVPDHNWRTHIRLGGREKHEDTVVHIV